MRARDLPALAGVSKEAASVSTGFLHSRGYVAVEPVPAPERGKLVRLAAKGRDAQDAYRQLPAIIEQRWQARCGQQTIRVLRAILERFAGRPAAQLSPLQRGLEPYPDGWRASVRRPGAPPQFPVVSHRAGFPDGS